MIQERAEEIKVICIGRLKGTKQDKPKELKLLDGVNKIDYRGMK
jgi:hypothetical protein